MLKQAGQGKSGVSFVIRCRNEAEYLRKNLASLAYLEIPHEIIIVLHLCTDASREIAEEFQALGLPIRIVEYNIEVSRAGYETLATSADSPHSLMTYYKFCYALAEYNWIFKWDADFKATSGLIYFLETELNLDEFWPLVYKIGCDLGGETTNAERYLFNHLEDIQKYIFWEVPVFNSHADIDELKYIKINSISYKVLKDYWDHKPWFSKRYSGTAEMVSYEIIHAMCGPEPKGAARASNPECDPLFTNVLEKQTMLEKLGIKLYS